MRLGIFAKTFEGTDPNTVFAAVKSAGYLVCQYNLACSCLPSMPDVFDAVTAERVKTATQTHNIEINALSGTYNMIHPDPLVREKGHQRLRIVAEYAAAMGAPLVTLCTGTRDAADQWRHHPENSTAEAWADLLQSLEIALSIADEFGVDLGVEPEHANVIANAALAEKLITTLQHPRVKIVLDAANLIETETGEAQRRLVSDAIERLADHIVMAHAKDRNAEGEFTTAGTGILNYRHFLHSLKEIGFDGPLVTHGLKPEEAPKVARFLRGQLAEVDA